MSTFQPSAIVLTPGEEGTTPLRRIGYRIQQRVPDLVRAYIAEHGEADPQDPPPSPLLVHTLPEDSTLYITHREDGGFGTGHYIQVDYDSIDDLVIALLTLKRSMLPDGVDPDDLFDDEADEPTEASEGVPS